MDLTVFFTGIVLYVLSYNYNLNELNPIVSSVYFSFLYLMAVHK